MVVPLLFLMLVPVVALLALIKAEIYLMVEMEVLEAEAGADTENFLEMEGQMVVMVLME